MKSDNQTFLLSQFIEECGECRFIAVINSNPKETMKARILKAINDYEEENYVSIVDHDFDKKIEQYDNFSFTTKIAGIETIYFFEKIEVY